MNSHDARKTPAPASDTESEDDQEYPVHECEVCRTEMYGLHCKIICPNCGYRRDCSDP